MIAVSSSSRSFAALGKYLVVGRDKVDEGRVAWTSARNLPTDDPELAAKIMRATASQNVRVSQPVYHLALSFDPRDVVDRATMERVADHVLEELQLKEYQAIIVAHADRAHPHMHILVNRVHPETGRVWDRWQDQPVIQRVLREEEQRLGLRAVAASLDTTRERGDTERNQRHATAFNVEPQLPAQERQRSAATSSLQSEFDTYDRVNELARERYSAERGVAAAGARAQQVEAAVLRAERARDALNVALAKAYQDPDAVRTSFLNLADERGRGDAVRAMRESPESYGEMIATRDGGRLFGRTQTFEPARAAAREAAGYGAELISARMELARMIGLGDMHAAITTPIESHAARDRVTAELDMSRRRLESVRSAQRTMPTSEQIDFRLLRALRRLSPREVEQLRWTLSPQRLTLAHKLRQAARDVILGREGA